jgi:hypothetical protein
LPESQNHGNQQTFSGRLRRFFGKGIVRGQNNRPCQPKVQSRHFRLPKTLCADFNTADEKSFSIRQTPRVAAPQNLFFDCEPQKSPARRTIIVKSVTKFPTEQFRT